MVYFVIGILPPSLFVLSAFVLSAVMSMAIGTSFGVLMVNRLGSNLYDESQKYEKMLDIENSVIVIAGLIPWCIASSVPMSTLGVGRRRSSLHVVSGSCRCGT